MGACWLRLGTSASTLVERPKHSGRSTAKAALDFAGWVDPKTPRCINDQLVSACGSFVASGTWHLASGREQAMAHGGRWT
jgi:hypothetical protein